MKAIVNGLIVSNCSLLEDHVICFDETIQHILHKNNFDEGTVEEVIDANGNYVLPGFIDVHIHGYQRADVMDGTIESLKQIARGIAANGVTSFLPTTMTMSEEKIRTALSAIKESMNGKIMDGAQILGAHMEGPYISKDYEGAQPDRFIVSPTDAIIKDYLDVVKVVTLAPEVNGAMTLIRDYSHRIRFSMGHSKATYKIGMEAIKEGASSITHLFNAMSGLHHRELGLVGIAFTQDIYAEIIADGIHTKPELFQIIFENIGAEKLLLITDCIEAGGMDDGDFSLGEHSVHVENGKCTLKDGTLAGSTLKLNDAFIYFMKQVNGSMTELLPSVTMNQAKYLGIDNRKGSLEVKKDADIVLMDREYKIMKTIVKGEIIYDCIYK